MKKRVYEKTRARIEMLAYIGTFFLSRSYDGGKTTYGGLREHYFEPNEHPSEGDLVALSCAPMSKWYLSWYRGYKPMGNSFRDIHILESIEDGQLCNWTNVSLMTMNRTIVEGNPQWKWTDGQFVFRNKWHRACRGLWDIPLRPKFKDDGSVILTIRKRHGKEMKSISFSNWKKALSRDMAAFCNGIKWEED
jgi:hypothetical protein